MSLRRFSIYLNKYLFVLQTPSKTNFQIQPALFGLTRALFYYFFCHFCSLSPFWSLYEYLWSIIFMGFFYLVKNLSIKDSRILPSDVNSYFSLKPTSCNCSPHRSRISSAWSLEIFNEYLPSHCLLEDSTS